MLLLRLKKEHQFLKETRMRMQELQLGKDMGVPSINCFRLFVLSGALVLLLVHKGVASVQEVFTLKGDKSNKC